MQAFLKKAGIGVVCLLLVVAVFWHSFTATAFWGLTLAQTWSMSSISTTPTESLASPLGQGTASSTLIGGLLMPHIFTDTQVLQQGESITIFNDQSSNDRYLVAPMATFTANLMANGSTQETQQLCAALQQTFAGDPCLDDKAYLDAVMSVSRTSAGLFSSQTKKTAVGTFIFFKSAYLPSNTNAIHPIVTDTLSGYIAHAPNKSIAYVFDQAGTGYEITYVNMEQSLIETALASIQTSNSTQ